MHYSRKELALYRISRAKEALNEAKLLGASHYWNTAANRLYYSCFYSASAYLIMNNFKHTTHNGVEIGFNKELIQKGLIKREYGQV